MEEAILQEISRVFRLSQDDAKELLSFIEEKKEIPNNEWKEYWKKSKEYILTLFTKIPEAKFYDESSTNDPSETEIYFNREHASSGEFGVVYPNKSKKDVVYKVLSNRAHEEHQDFPIYERQYLEEAVLNVILQVIPEAKPFVCKIDSVFWYLDPNPYYKYYHLVMKLENLKGSSVKDTLVKKYPFLKEKTANSNNSNNYYYDDEDSIVYPVATEEQKKENEKLLIQIMAPLYRVIGLLWEAYRFNHGDLHTGNIMFVENPLREDGTFDESKLAVKMIDFGFSSIEIEGHRYGVKTFRYIDKDISIFKFFYNGNQLPDEISARFKQTLEYTSMKKLIEDVKEFEAYIVSRKAQMAGRRKQSRKQRKKGKKTAKKVRHI